MPSWERQCSAESVLLDKLTPALSRKSALPDWDVTDLLPCFTTRPPAAHTTNAESVEQLKIFKPDPPVPQVSIKSV